MLSKKNSMVTMVTDEFLENRIILQKSVATIGFIWFFWFQKCILLYIFVQVFLVMRSIRSHISLFRLGFTPTLKTKHWRCIELYIFGILMTRQTIWHYFQRNQSMFQFLTHIDLSRSMAAIWEMPQSVAYQKNVAYAFIKLSAKSHSFNILCTMDVLSCPTNNRTDHNAKSVEYAGTVICQNVCKHYFGKIILYK